MYKHKNGIHLHKIEEYHLEILLQLKNESWFGTHQTTVANMVDQKKWFNNLSSNSLYMIAYVEGNEVGLYKMTNIDWISRRYDSGHDIFSYYRGKGHGKALVEAGVDFSFEVLNMHRIDTEVLENNIASQKTILFGGYTQEGIKRKTVYKCGEWLDSICYGLLREEWEKLPRVKAYGGLCNFSYTPKNQIRA